MADLTQEDVSNLTSSLKEMTKVIENNNKLLLKSGDIYNNARNTQKEINKNLEKQGKIQKDISAEYKKQSALIENTKELTGEILSNFTKLSLVFTSGGIIGAVAKIVKDSINLDNVTTKLAARMGKMVQKAELKGAVNSLQAEVGATYEAAVEMVSTLASKRYVDNIAEAAKGANLFSRATGVAGGHVASFVSELNKGAHLSTSSINAMLTGMVKVQQNIGLSEDGMLAATDAIQKAAVNMSAFGKSSDDIQKMANQTTALIGALEKVGVAAGEASQLVDRLTDPDRIEENILLYSQLGVSMEDALSGNFDLSSMDGQLKEMAQKIVDMGPIAGSQFAKSMGMSYKQATQMAKMEGNEVSQVSEAAQTAEEGALDTMKQLEKQTEGFGESMQTAFNKAEGRIRQLPKVALVAGGLLIATLLTKAKKKLAEFSQDVSSPKQMSVLTEGIGSAITLGFGKGLNIAEKSLLQTGKTAKRAIGQWFDSTAVGGFFNGTEKRVDALMAKANKKTFADVYLDSARKNRIDILKEHEKLLDQQKQTELNKLNELLDAKQKRQLRNSQNKDATLSQILNSVSEENGGTKAERARLKAIQEIIKAYQNEDAQQTKIAKKISLKEKDQKAIAGAQQRINSALEEYSKREEAVSNVSEAIAKAKEDQKNAESEIQKLTKLTEAAMKQSGPASTKLVKEYERQLAEQEAILAVAKQTEDEQEDALKKAKDALKVQQKKVDLAEDEKRKIEATIKPQSMLTKLAKGFATNMIAAASQKFNNSTFGKAYNAARGKGGGWVKGAVAGAGAVAADGASKALGGIAKGIGGITKSLGPMAIVMAVIGKIMSRLQEPIEKLVDGLMTFLEPVMDILINTLGPALTKIVKGLFPPMLKIAARILQFMGIILTPLKLILKALSKLPVVGKAFEGVNDVIETLTGPELTQGLLDAAEKIENSGDDLTKAAKKQEDAADGQQEAAKISASGGNLTLVESAKTNANPQASSTTQTTTESSTDAQIKDIENKKKQKKEDTHRNIVEGHLEKIYKSIESLVNILANQDKKEFIVGAGVQNFSLETANE
jgi:hypothetical protein